MGKSLCSIASVGKVDAIPLDVFCDARFGHKLHILQDPLLMLVKTYPVNDIADDQFGYDFLY